MPFTPEEFAAMAAADAEIEREFDEMLNNALADDYVQHEIDAWLDSLPIVQ